MHTVKTCSKYDFQHDMISPFNTFMTTYKMNDNSFSIYTGKEHYTVAFGELDVQLLLHRKLL